MIAWSANHGRLFKPSISSSTWCSCKSPFHRGPGNPDPVKGKGKASYTKLGREPGKLAA